MSAPLADQLRPKTLEEIVGQDHLVGSNGFLKSIIDTKTPLSILLWGPPGSGKTSIARLYAKAFNYRFETLNAVFSGVADIKRIVKQAQEQPLFKGVVLFVDEIHRFNKAQQDAFLPYVENGTIILIGATAENPSFYINSALLSRLRVLTLNALNDKALEQILNKYEKNARPLPVNEEGKKILYQLANGDGRFFLNLVENIATLNIKHTLSEKELLQILQKKSALYDKKGDQHYNLISALHKSVRGSDPDAAIYWFTRMLDGGEDPLYIARRLIRMATEDIGLADPQALILAIAAKDAYEMLGSPEGELALAQIVIYLSLAPKSCATYDAFNKAKSIASKTSHLSPPNIILNAPTKLMKEIGYGKDYFYDHEAPEAFSGQNYFPEGLDRHHFYYPVERGFERELAKRIHYFSELRKKRNS
ncbi:Replication-associated recombination protein A [Candidatus Rubidus massiliensis]|nr:MAG: AAA family ATPase [Chlamydia sp. 32-24]CDZ80585.1 Replication-associated recombination protein A [Candidatus Rubidus massiliensis]